MAYGGKNTRSSISDQITAAIEADMESSSSETKGKGFSLGQRIISDTQSEVAKLKSDADKGSKAGVIRNRKDKEDDDSSLASNLFGFAKNWISEIRGAAEETTVAKVGKAADLIPEKEEVAYFPEVEVNPKVISGQLEERSKCYRFSYG